MEQENTKSAVFQSKKESLTTYVHDAVEMEVRRHTVNHMIQEAKLKLNDKLCEIHNNYSNIVNAYKKQISELQIEKNELDKQLENNIRSADIVSGNCENEIRQLEQDTINCKPKSVWKYIGEIIRWFPIGFIVAIISLLTAGVYNNIYPQCKESKIALAVFMGIIILHILIAVACKAADQSNYSKSQTKNSQQIDELRKQIDEYKALGIQTANTHKIRIPQIHFEIQQINEKISDASFEEEKEKESITLIINDHIKKITQKLETVESQISEFYSINLIPPDYRSLECVIAFDQMFRNDLVDNMREAALLYDERVFRGEMVKGLDNIYSAINTLGGLMSETISVLRNIEFNTDRMCDELIDMSSNLVRMNANVTGHLSTISGNISSLGSSLDHIADSQSDIASELEYSRYANDAIRANSDRMIWYAEQHRQGLL